MNIHFLLTSEGRAVPDLASGGWDYEYFLKDHMGNTRVSVGTETDTLTFSATMETANATEEETYFKNLPETRHQDALYNHTRKAIPWKK